MKYKQLTCSLIGACVALAPLSSAEEESGNGVKNEPAAVDVGWPRQFATDTHSVIVYQPQVDEWIDYRQLKMRLAVGIAEKGKEDDDASVQYGAVFTEVTTSVNRETRQVLLTERKVTKTVFSGVDEAGEEKLSGILKSALPDKQELIVSLDRIVAAIELTEQQQRQAEASDEVPPIFVSTEPALLMMFMGEPDFAPVGDSGLEFATNTNWDVFKEGDSSYFLRVEENWYMTKDAAGGTWVPAVKLPAGFAKIPKDDNWTEVVENLPGKPATSPVKVFYTDRPAELIVVEGEPIFSSLVGDRLEYVRNTEADLFYHRGDKAYYFLSAGRWFVAKKLDDSWALAEDLPAEFAMIPADHEKSYVLANVAGTPAAEEAVIMASIPESAAIDRNDMQLQVAYEGEPQFSEVPGSKGVEFGVNTNYDVFRVNPNYYCCYQAVWFVSAAPAGPWVVCDNVPAAIYTVPADHPKHNVTYVYVTDSTPTTVYTSYTSGYQGTYVVRGAVMFGLGYWLAKERYKYNYPAHYHYRYHCRPPYYGYGCRARVSHYGGYTRAGGRYYGPYGGAGRAAVYNPSTGGWARGGYAYGPRGSVSARAGYNPYTNTQGRQARATTPYGSWSKGVVSRDGNWARGGTATTRRGRAGGATGSEGGAILHGNKRFGGQGTIAKTPGGDVYVGRNGEVNKLDPNGNWQTRQGNDWQNSGKSSLNRASTTSGAGRVDTSRLPGTGASTGRISTRPTNGAAGTRPSTRPSTGTTPGRPATLPGTGTTPNRPSTTPSRPSTTPTRPSTTPTRPSTTPTRPATTPTRPATTPTRQLDRDAYSRHRGTQQTQRSSSRSTNRSSGRSAPSRSGGGGRRGR